MKIKTRKLTLALCLLLISATLLGTASFAWFSMNTEVDVDGIEVEAYSDSIFLEIATEKTGTYADSVSFAGEKKYLRVAKHGFVSAAYTLEAELISAPTTYESTKTYYEKIELADSNYKYVLATGLTGPSSVKDLYMNPTFVEITDDNAKMVTGETYYEKLGSQFVKKAYVLDAPAVGLYTLAPVYTVIDDADAKAVSGTTYYQFTGSVYTDVTSTLTPDTSPVNGYYTAAPIAPQADGAVYDGSSTYYKLDGENYLRVDNLNLGSDVKGYYTLKNTPTPIAADKLDEVTGEVFVKSDAAEEYSLLGDFAAPTDINNMLYFGRAYSDTLDNGDADDTLNIIKDGTSPDYLSNYRYAKTVFIRNGEGTTEARNLQANFTVDGNHAITDAVRVVLVVYDVTESTPVYLTNVEYSNKTGAVTYGDGTRENIVNLLKGNEAQTLQVDLYVYYDGTDDSVKNKTTDILNLTGDTIKIEFTVDGRDYN